MRKACISVLVITMGMMMGTALGDTLISKPPDVGPYWISVGNGGHYVFANCFFAPDTDVKVETLGTWLLALPNHPSPHAVVCFEIWGTAISGGPDCTQVIASTDSMQTEDSNLVLYTLPVVSGPATLTPGQKYWFAISAIGMGNPSYGEYQVGGHTQNSVYMDGCMFWHSPQSDGCIFHDDGLTPEMAFEVLLTTMSGIENSTPVRALMLHRSVPNPLIAGETGMRIGFELPEDAAVRLEVYDVQGRVVRTLLDSHVHGGSHSVLWDGRDADARVEPSGIYFYTLKVGGRTLTRQAQVVR